ncbi:uncharacterized protein PHALS_15200 [Plasmopara halstedii]|uniref:Uncharacterized protein n=1 Tax=Plasmopara halstedii TaxID=4781 RepID=A0A0P1B649_PLAHL|nr:uncharacterized protein PHALS_15200 [Plasmopara halstedii]CEG49183.1 hypothetical protein PHALS_15200 [Plasmopara halstedii]|eukprot:XP_024585552.1 hypothetical protein PHALS_15200 [Plasmopara halstedii]
MSCKLPRANTPYQALSTADEIRRGKTIVWLKRLYIHIKVSANVSRFFSSVPTYRPQCNAYSSSQNRCTCISKPEFLPMEIATNHLYE